MSCRVGRADSRVGKRRVGRVGCRVGAVAMLQSKLRQRWLERACLDDGESKDAVQLRCELGCALRAERLSHASEARVHTDTVITPQAVKPRQACCNVW